MNKVHHQIVLLSLSTLFLVPVFSPVYAEPIDRMVAAVNDEVITESELDFTAALNLRLGADKRDRETIEAETLTGIINRRLLVQEAHRLRFVEVTDEAVSAERDKAIKRFGSDKAFADFLAEHNMSDQEFSHILGEQLLVTGFVEKKMGLFVRVSREDAQAYFDQHRAEFPGKRFPDVQKNIFAILTDRKVGQQLDQYVEELRSKADIRMNR